MCSRLAKVERLSRLLQRAPSGSKDLLQKTERIYVNGKTSVSFLKIKYFE